LTIQILLSPRDDVPVNAIELLCLDQFALVAATGNADRIRACGAPPAAGTTNNPQVCPTRRLNRMRAPSGEKQGHKSWLPEVTNLIEVFKGEGGGLPGESAPHTDPPLAISMRTITFKGSFVSALRTSDFMVRSQ
jgi:hypothetical protein